MSDSAADSERRGWRNDLRSLLWVTARARSVLHWSQVLVDMRLQGGTVVQVPTRSPLIRTVIQLDGDMVTFVDPKLFSGRSADELEALIEQHRQAVQARLPQLHPDLLEHLVGCGRILRYGWTLGVLVPELAGSATWYSAWLTLRPLLLLQPVILGVPLALRYGGPPLLRWVLRSGLLHWLRPPRPPGGSS